MKRTFRNIALATTAAAGLALSFQAASHMVKEEPRQSYRQSYFTLLAMNFGPIGAMVKGEMPWDDAMVKTFANELAALASMDVSRAFAPGSEQGTTRAKPGIWENPDDFKSKLGDLQTAVATLQEAANSGDRKAIAEATGATGKACKSCHDEYKAKDYLY